MIPISIKHSFVKLSEPVQCEKCDETVKLVGELRENGNWYCPSCEEINIGDFIPEVPFIKFDAIEEKSSSVTPLMGGMLFGTGTPSFPMNLSTGFLVPSYSYKIVRKRRILIASTEDF